MSLLNVALDDVGSGSGYVAYAGYVGFSPDWGPFSESWEHVLREKGLPSLHTADYLRANPPPQSTDPQQHQWGLIEPFAQVIHNSQVFGICIGIEHAAYNAMPREHRQLCGRPEELAFEAFISAIAKWTHGLNPRDRVTLMVDENKKGDLRMYGVYREFKRQNPILDRTLVSISFGNDSSYAPIQAADLLGNCFHKAIRNHLRDPEANLSFDLLTRRLLPADQRGYAEFIFDAEALRNLIEQRLHNPRFLPEI